MSHLDLENKIYAACNCPLSRRNFTESEILYILNNESFRENLLSWFESTLSDGCWTEQAVRFMRSFYPPIATLPEGDEQRLNPLDDVVF